MRKKMELYLTILTIVGIIVSIFGAIGTYYQILGKRFLWIVLIFLGFTPPLFYLWKVTNEIRTVVATFGERWRLIDGQLKIGNTINVALRVKTVQELLNAFQKVLPGEEYDVIVRDAGRIAGESFADDLRAELIDHREETINKTGRDHKTLKEKLSLWAEYDSSTGIGLFNVDEVVTRGGLKGDLLLKNSFLKYGRHSETQTCIFIEGYLEGVLSKILEMPISVTEIKCSAVSDSSNCKFKIEGSISTRSAAGNATS